MGRPGALPLYMSGLRPCNSAASKASVPYSWFRSCCYSPMGGWWSFYIVFFLPSCSSFSHFHQPWCFSGGGWRFQHWRIWKQDLCSRLLLWTTTLIPPYCWTCQCSSSCFQERTGTLQLVCFFFTYFASLSSCSSTISWIQCKAKPMPKEIFFPSFPSHYPFLLAPCDHIGTWWSCLGLEANTIKSKAVSSQPE